MPQKEYEIAFKLAATKAGSFANAFSTAEKSVSSLGEQIAEMDRRASDLQGVIEARKKLSDATKASKSALLSFQSLRDRSVDLSKKTQDLSDEYGAATDRLKRLERQIDGTDSVSADLANSYEEQKKKVADLGKALQKAQAEEAQMQHLSKKAQTIYEGTKKKLDSERFAVSRLDAEMDTAGKSIKDLAAMQKDLEQASADATAQLKRQTAIQAKMDKIAAARSRVDAVNGGINRAGMAVGGMAAGAATAVGGSAMAAGGALMKMGTEYQASLNQLQAATGLSAEEMQKLEASARNIYKLGLGESFSEVTAAMATMRQVSGLTGQALEDATKNAIALGQTFDIDVNESGRAAATMMKQFGIDGKKAYDLIAYAAQNGANKNGDLLDTFNEYAVQFKALGFTADEFTATLVQGAKDGAWSIDKVGDAVKEFNIRAKDGSKTSMEAFDMLGINGTKATQMFAAGGERAQLAFAEVVKRLRDIEDPVKKNAIGVALFGTQFEDLEKGALDSFAAIKGASIDAAGSMDQISELITQDLGTQIRIVSRQFQDSLAPASKQTADAFAAQMPQISKAIEQVTPYIERLGSAFTQMLPSIIDWGTTVVTKVGEGSLWVIENFDKISTVVGYAAKAFIGLKIGLVAASSMMRMAEVALAVRKALVGVRVGAVAATVGTKAMAAASTVATGAMKAFRLATIGVGAAMKFLAANPITLVIGAIGALALAGNYIIKNWDEVSAKAQALYQSFKANLVDAMAPLIAQFEAIGASVQAVFTNIIGFVQNVFTGQWSAAWENAKSIFENTFSALAGIVKAPLNAVIAMINSVIKSINQMGSFKVPDWVPGIGGEGFDMKLPEIPMLAQGGIATKPTLATIAEGGEAEAVIPLSRLNQMLDPLAQPPEEAPLTRANAALSASGVVAPAAGASPAPLSINFAPVITVNGQASAQDMADQLISLLRQKLPEEVQRLYDRQSRLSFA